MYSWESIYKDAKNCHTKTAWEKLFLRHDLQIRTSTSSKPLQELYRLLKDDPQCQQYAPDIWEALLEGCLSAWNLELGAEIAEFIQKLPSAKTAIPAAKVYAESGHPLTARRTASRALRLSRLSTREKLHLEMIICQSYVEEGNRTMAIRLLNKMQSTVENTELDKATRAQFVSNIARTNFFLGRYTQAGHLFNEAYSVNLESQNWYEAARSVYNAASSYFSAGGKHQERAYKLVEECRRISEAHSLQGPLSHVEAFYGHDDYWHGNFAGARDHYRRAHKYIPTSDKSYRTLHVLSMLAFIYLRTGQFSMAKKFGTKTLELAKRDESERFRSRYHNLRAELMWEEGAVLESQDFLREKTLRLISHGVNTLEELSTLSRFYLQAAKLGDASVSPTVEVGDQLRKNTGDWLEFLNAKGQLLLAQNSYTLAEKAFQKCRDRASQYGDKYHFGLSLLGLIQLKLAQDDTGDHVKELSREFEVAMAKLGETPINVHIHLIRAAFAYREQEFEKCRQFLDAAANLTRVSYVERFVIDVWRATANGKSKKVGQRWQRDVLRTLTKIYFNPSLAALGSGNYRVSGNYHVDLSNHPAMVSLLEYLLHTKHFSASPDDIQRKVWNQSITAQGWRQKIRNTITRLRDKFPYTMAPLFLHDDNIQLFHEVVHLQPSLLDSNDPKVEVLRMLRDGPMSTIHLANRMNISVATAKRILKRLNDEEQITVMKVGRRVFYQSLSTYM